MHREIPDIDAQVGFLAVYRADAAKRRRHDRLGDVAMGDDVLERRSRELIAAVGGFAGEAVDRLEEQGLATRP